MPHRVTGYGLLTLVSDFNRAAPGYESRARVAVAAGYYTIKPDGSTRIDFLAFYGELIRVKTLLGLFTPPDPDESDEDEDEDNELTKMEETILARFPEVDEEDLADFAKAMEEDFSFTPQDVVDNFRGHYSSSTEFAEAEYENQHGYNIPTMLQAHIDWDGVYDSEYDRDHDYYECPSNNKLYFFYIGG